MRGGGCAWARGRPPTSCAPRQTAASRSSADGDPGALERALADGRIAVAGTPARGAPGKLAAPAPETLAWLAAHTDALFLEADGSRRLPVKFPNSTEPVIPDGTAG